MRRQRNVRPAPLSRMQRKLLRLLFVAIDRQYGGTWRALLPVGDLAHIASIEVSTVSPYFERDQTAVRIDIVINNEGRRR